MSNPTVSVVVPTFRRPEALRATLAALLGLDYDKGRYEVVIVDDNGGDELTSRAVDKLRDGDVAVTMATADQRGAACARNLGARRAGGELLLFCDDDIVVGPAHLREHLRTRERHTDPIVNAAWDFAPGVREALQRTPFGRFRLELERHFQDTVGGEPCRDGSLRMPLLGSWDLVLRREMFWELGGFDEEFPVAGAEDQDFSLRARAAGCLLLLDPSIRCLHNDNRVSRRAYCAREERNAQTMPVLARKYPREFGEVPYVRENRPISRDDSLRVATKKGIKAILSASPVLEILHGVARVLETARTPDRVMNRLYKILLGLHLYRGFRRSWA